MGDAGRKGAHKPGDDSVGLSEIDRNLLDRCLQGKPRAWEDFVDRFMGLLIHVINHTAQARSVRLSIEDRDDLCAEILLAIVKNDFALLRRFRGESSLATYLTVVARRLVIHSLLDRKSAARLSEAVMHGQDASTGAGRSNAAGQPNGAGQGGTPIPPPVDAEPPVEQRISNAEQVDRLMDGLADGEKQIVRLYHLEGLTYKEISSRVNMPMGTIGPILTRARAKMRQAGVDSPAG